jgi:signal peptidase I
MADRLFADLTADLLRLGHRVRFRATGESMHPTIRQGDAITVQPVVPSDVRFADIILYQAPKGVIAHRVISRRKANGAMESFLVRGDASDTCDQPVAAEHVLGRVTMVERGDRLIALDSRTAKMFHLVSNFAYRLKRRIENIGG